MARYWLHNEMLQVEGKKMSKSLGNFFTVRDLLDQGVPGEVIRFVMLSTHYRKPMDWTEKKRLEAVRQINQWRLLERNGLTTEISNDELLALVHEDVVDALKDDLNTSLALKRLRDLFLRAKLSEVDGPIIKSFVATVRFLGFKDLDVERLKRRASVERTFATVRLKELSKMLAEERDKANSSKDFSSVDRIKAELIEAGIEVRMSRDGIELIPGANFDSSKLEAIK
jgi:cysteinyl-tRNA synthetase